eukprot:3452271-Prymnesium_polylepis.1
MAGTRADEQVGSAGWQRSETYPGRSGRNVGCTVRMPREGSYGTRGHPGHAFRRRRGYGHERPP